MRRSLVLTDESARHPFRASLPPHVLRPAPAAAASNGGTRARGWVDADDVRGFLSAYCACLVAVTTFLL